MGQKLMKYYEDAAKIGSLQAKMRLAVLTNTPSSKAAAEEDSPENLRKFEEAMKELIKQYK